MAPDERDRRFDKALARHLRSAAPSGEAGALPVVPASESGACPDSETLAAYHERSLLPEEMNSWKEHIVGCANCQTIFAHLEATDEIPFEAAEEEKVLAQGESALLTPASNESQSASPRTLAKKSRRVRLLRGARWQWLAPAGALAAGLLVWIALHENQSLRKIEGRLLFLPFQQSRHSLLRLENRPVPPGSRNRRSANMRSPLAA